MGHDLAGGELVGSENGERMGTLEIRVHKSVGNGIILQGVAESHGFLEEDGAHYHCVRFLFQQQPVCRKAGIHVELVVVEEIQGHPGITGLPYGILDPLVDP